MGYRADDRRAAVVRKANSNRRSHRQHLMSAGNRGPRRPHPFRWDIDKDQQAAARPGKLRDTALAGTEPALPQKLARPAAVARSWAALAPDDGIHSNTGHRIGDARWEQVAGPSSPADPAVARTAAAAGIAHAPGAPGMLAAGRGDERFAADARWGPVAGRQDALAAGDDPAATDLEN